MNPLVLSIGGINHDTTLQLIDDPAPGASNRVIASQAPGGVARNVAEVLARLGVRAHLFGAVGDDAQGQEVLAQTGAAGVDPGGVLVRAGGQTGGYTAVLDSQGELYIGLADMRLTEALTPEMLKPLQAKISEAGLVFADANLMPETLTWVSTQCADVCMLAVDLVSPEKARRVVGVLMGTTIVFGNRQEAARLLGGDGPVAELAAEIVRSGATRALITDGSGAVAYCDADEQHLVTPEPVDLVDVSGAGDALIAGFLAGHLAGKPACAALKIGMAAARATVQSPGRIATGLTMNTLISATQTSE